MGGGTPLAPLPWGSYLFIKKQPCLDSWCQATYDHNRCGVHGTAQCVKATIHWLSVKTPHQGPLHWPTRPVTVSPGGGEGVRDTIGGRSAARPCPGPMHIVSKFGPMGLLHGAMAMPGGHRRRGRRATGRPAASPPTCPSGPSHGSGGRGSGGPRPVHPGVRVCDRNVWADPRQRPTAPSCCGRPQDGRHPFCCPFAKSKSEPACPLPLKALSQLPFCFSSGATWLPLQKGQVPTSFHQRWWVAHYDSIRPIFPSPLIFFSTQSIAGIGASNPYHKMWDSFTFQTLSAHFLVTHAWISQRAETIPL